MCCTARFCSSLVSACRSLSKHNERVRRRAMAVPAISDPQTWRRSRTCNRPLSASETGCVIMRSVSRRAIGTALCVLLPCVFCSEPACCAARAFACLCSLRAECPILRSGVERGFLFTMRKKHHPSDVARALLSFSPLHMSV